MKKHGFISQPMIRNTALIFLCFLLTSTGYLAWLYHLMDLVPANTSDILTMVMGYSLQALGIGIFALMCRISEGLTSRGVFSGFLIAYFVCLIPSVLSPEMAWAIIFGLISNLLCGFIAGFYLHALTTDVASRYRALSFGLGYGISTLASWLLSLTGSAIYYSAWVLAVCAVLTVITLLLLFIGRQKTSHPDPDNNTTDDTGPREPAYSDSITEDQPGPAGLLNQHEQSKLVILACVVLLLFSLVNNIGFSFPTEDLANGVSLELSRLFYAAGLIIAGLVSDRSRKHGALCALAALVIPFIMLSLRGEPVSSIIFWALGYFAFGFYSVYRVILFSDISQQRKMLYLACFGLFIGRIGDAAGKGICIALERYPLALIISAAVLFVVSVFFFFRLYQKFYVPSEPSGRTEREIFNSFASRHDLSAREREVLRLLLEEKSNSEIAENLFVSDSTVKYHIHNLLKKTGCKNRLELITRYHSS